ncbi:NAD(P)H-binding protein [Parasalinivibrio latis]|uniref:NAD(P)H-binding protein n=1 Tax=Parasalinivibrio latis TaxID=2952610 RepID=UPI0030DEB9B1
MKVTVCGCGWLGLPLAEKLVIRGDSVRGSKRERAAAAALVDRGIEGFVFDLANNEKADPAYFTSDVVIVNIAPGRNNINGEAFAQRMKGWLERMAMNSECNLLFISTTSVYGEPLGTVTESTVPVPETQSGMAHLEIEKAIQQCFGGRATILRLAGLIGEDRHPVKFLAGRQLTNGEQPVNLVHREDVIEAIIKILDLGVWGEILHLSAQENPTRNSYYTWGAERLGLEKPVFEPGGQNAKVVDPSRTLEILNLALKYPSPYDML